MKIQKIKGFQIVSVVRGIKRISMKNSRKVTMYLASGIFTIFILFLLKALSFDITSVERKGWSVISSILVIPLIFSWLIYVIASLASEGSKLNVLRKINIILPLFLVSIIIFILPNFIDINNEVVWQRWVNSMGFLAIISMITEIITFFIKKQN